MVALVSLSLQSKVKIRAKVTHGSDHLQKNRFDSTVDALGSRKYLWLEIHHAACHVFPWLDTLGIARNPAICTTTS